MIYNRSIVPFFFCMFSIMKAADDLILVSSEGKEIKISPDVVKVSPVLQKCKQHESIDYSEQQLILLRKLSIFERDYLQKEGVTCKSIDLFGQLFSSNNEDYYVGCFELADFFDLRTVRKLLVEKVALELNYQDLPNGRKCIEIAYPPEFIALCEQIEMTYSPKFINLLELRLKEKEGKK